MRAVGGAMSYYDYKIVPAPTSAKRVKGVKAASDLFAITLTEAVNEVARQGWEYVRSESMSADTPGGFLRRGKTEEVVLLVFRRPREHLSPRLAADTTAPPIEPAGANLGPASEAPPDPPQEIDTTDTQFVDEVEEATTAPPIAWRSAPRLGPAEKS